MKGRYTVQDAYRARITADVSPISASGDPLTEFEIPVSSLPTDTEGRLVLDYNDATKRDKVYFHRVSGSSIYYYRKNRSNPTVLHEENAYIQMNNFAERFNYGFDNTDDFGLILDMGTNKAQILGGLVDIGAGVVEVASTSIETLADGTHYAVLDYADTTLKFVSSYDITTHLLVGQVVVASSDITSRVDKRHTKIFSNRSTLLKLSESGGNLLYNGVPIGGGSGTGDVIGPSSSIDEEGAIFDGLTGKVIKGTGGYPGKAVVLANLSADQSCNDDIIIYDTEILDKDSEYDNATGVFTAKSAGYYFVSANIIITGGNTYLHTISIRKNGTDYIKTGEYGRNSRETGPQVCGLVELGIGDTIDIYATSGLAIDLAKKDISKLSIIRF